MTIQKDIRRIVPVIAGLSDEALDELLAAGHDVTAETNEHIAECGEDVRILSIVLAGAARAESLTSTGRSVEIGRVGAGDIVGLMALMTGEPHPVTIIAAERCHLLQVPIDLFRGAVMKELPVMQALSRELTTRLREVLADPERASALNAEGATAQDLPLQGGDRQTILVLNAGSSSLKYAVYDTGDPSRGAHGRIERIGLADPRHVYDGPKGRTSESCAADDHRTAIGAVLERLQDPSAGLLQGSGDISVVGHRVVHGGERFAEAAVITDAVLDRIDELSKLAPLHNPLNRLCILAARERFPSVPHVAVFDTAFHQTLPSFAYLYGLPYSVYEDHGVRRYGFHGTSHRYVGLMAARHLGRRLDSLEIISCHLGNGASLCAIDHGRSVDTTMGFTPSEGLIMGTRAGDVDPGAITHLQRTTGMDADAIDHVVNRESGLLGLSGVSSDMREVEAAADAGNHRAILALRAFCYRVRKGIGAAAAAMGGLDAIVFTGGIGEGSAKVRTLALQGLEGLGIRLDETTNRDPGDGTVIISAPDAEVRILIVPTDEERMIAYESLRALERYHVTEVLRNQEQQPIPVEVSARHVHLAKEHVEALFGVGHELTSVSELSQPGQFASAETVDLIGPRGRIDRARVLGPTRRATQIEIAMTDQYRLGIDAPIRESGDLDDTPGLTLEGPAGVVSLDQGVICAQRHLHMPPADALRYGVRDGSVVRVRVAGARELVFGDVLVRVHPDYALALHIDTDEGNAANVRSGMQGFIVEVQR